VTETGRNNAYKVGDMVRINPDYIFAGQVVKIVHIENKPSHSDKRSYTLDTPGLDRDKSGWSERHFEYVSTDVGVDPAQPAIFSSYEESRIPKQVAGGDVTDPSSAVSFEIYSNYNSEGSIPNSHDAPVIFMQAERSDHSSEAVWVGLSIEQAKELALALFDQILYHESLRAQRGN